MSSIQETTTYSFSQKALHWAVLAFCAAQFVTGPKIAESNMAKEGLGHSVWMNLAHKAHAVTGITILLLILARLFFRFRNGPTSAGITSSPAWLRTAAWLNHVALYALLLVLPITGYVAMYVSRSAAPIHGLLVNIGLVLVALHVVAAFWHQFVLKDDTLSRMMPARLKMR